MCLVIRKLHYLNICTIRMRSWIVKVFIALLLLFALILGVPSVKKPTKSDDVHQDFTAMGGIFDAPHGAGKEIERWKMFFFQLMNNLIGLIKMLLQRNDNQRPFLI